MMCNLISDWLIVSRLSWAEKRKMPAKSSRLSLLESSNNEIAHAPVLGLTVNFVYVF